MTILLFGKNGQLGWELQRSLARLGKLISLDSRDDGDFCGDLNNLGGLRETIRSLQPDVIVNAAAYTAVDKAESEVEKAMAINAEAPRVLAEEAEAIGACFVHYSTDFVFDGCRLEPYNEVDPAGPLSVYGRSKLAGDMAVVSCCTRHLVFRTSWVFGAHGKNFPKTIVKLATERTNLNVITDQVGTPTSAKLIAETTAAVLATMTPAESDDSRWGVYHLVAKGQTSWHDFAKYIVELAGAKGMQLRLSPNSIQAVTSAEYALPAVRPSYSVLNTRKIRDTFGLVLPCWKSGVDELIDQIAGA